MTPAQRRLRARLGGLAVHVKHDSHAIAKRARDGFLARFEREVDPEQRLRPHERRQKALLARRAHMTRLAMRSAKVRRRRAAKDPG